VASDFDAKCQGFHGIEFDALSGKTKPFSMNDHTTYAFRYDADKGGELRYVVDGVGIIDPKKSDRWHKLELLKQTDRFITAMNYIGEDYMLFTLYPKNEMLHIAWIEQPNIKHKNGNSLLIKVNCSFEFENT